MTDWFDPTAGVELLHPDSIKVGMRLADWRIANERQETVLVPLWTKSYDVGPQGGPWGRTSDGQHHGWKNNGFGQPYVWVHPEIRDEHMPPYQGEWITNDPEPNYALEWLTNAVELRTEQLPGRIYSLHRRRDGVSWVRRKENGQVWWSPVRWTHELAEAQFDAIVSGKGW